MALTWVQAEITNFGGDPGQVHLCGESAGAAITSHQLNFDAVNANGPKKAKKLFQKATMMSGSSDAGWAKWNSWVASLALRMAHDYLKDSEVGYEAKTYTKDSLVEFFQGNGK